LVKAFLRLVNEFTRTPFLLPYFRPNMKNRSTFWQAFFRYKIHHILFWLVYFVFWVSFYQTMYTFWRVVINTILYAIFNMIAFYTVVYYLFPVYLNRRRYGLFLLFAFATIVACSAMLAAGLLINMNVAGAKINYSFGQTFIVTFMSTSAMTGILASAKLIKGKIQSDRTNQQLEQQRLETELQYLKAQVNPHFLFNAINSVYFLIRKDPEKASETLIKLSDLLRFQLYDCSDEKIPFEKELEYLQNYMALEKLRKGERVKVEFATEGNLSGFQIAPFMLIPFLENAFKYVSNYADYPNTIRVEFLRSNEKFTARFFNTHESLPPGAVGGIGLKNVKRRLELLYPDQYELTIEEKPDTYFVTLSLKIA